MTHVDQTKATLRLVINGNWVGTFSLEANDLIGNIQLLSAAFTVVGQYGSDCPLSHILTRSDSNPQGRICT